MYNDLVESYANQGYGELVKIKVMKKWKVTYKNGASSIRNDE